MNELPIFDLEERLRLAGANLTYPSTPDIAGQVRRRLYGRPRPQPTRLRRLAWGAALVVILLTGLLAVPGVRAQVLEFLQIGIVRIFLVEPTPTPTSSPTAQASPAVDQAGAGDSLPVPPSTQRLASTPMASLLDFAGETSLEEAVRDSGIPIGLPAYPPDLGLPDRVFLQNLDGQVLVLVWLSPADPAKVRLSLLQFSGSDNMILSKIQPVTVLETTVAGNPAVWTEGPYLLKYRNGDIDIVRLIEGHVLIWEQAGVTYRLETDLPLEEAVSVAESIRPRP